MGVVLFAMASADSKMKAAMTQTRSCGRSRRRCAAMSLIRAGCRRQRQLLVCSKALRSGRIDHRRGTASHRLGHRGDAAGHGCGARQHLQPRCDWHTEHQRGLRPGRAIVAISVGCLVAVERGGRRRVHGLVELLQRGCGGGMHEREPAAEHSRRVGRDLLDECGRRLALRHLARLLSHFSDQPLVRAQCARFPESRQKAHLRYRAHTGGRGDLHLVY
mmetsp:Transcript_88634/g.255618  ORF Transcript_88634/g.255618 Transcript_88634/m.255618 type:complete len:218 (-) Transcript_88634:188-841(-)